MKGKAKAAPSLALFRQGELQTACGPIWTFNAGVHGAGILRCLLALLLNKGQGLLDASREVSTLCAFTAVHAIPRVVIHSGRLQLLPLACLVAHLGVTGLIWSVGVGWTPFLQGSHILLKLRLEVLVCIILTYQYQLSLPVMAVLHAVRQAAWMSILLWRMNAGPPHVLMRFIFNYTIMMLTSYAFERRMRAAHQKLCASMQQQQKQQEQQEEFQAGPSCSPLRENVRLT